MDASAPPFNAIRTVSQTATKATSRDGRPPHKAYGSLEEEDFGEQRESRVRLYGVDTPERGEPCFEEATERFRELAGGRVRIEFRHGARTRTAVLCSMSIPRQGRAWRRS